MISNISSIILWQILDILLLAKPWLTKVKHTRKLIIDKISVIEIEDDPAHNNISCRSGTLLQK